VGWPNGTRSVTNPSVVTKGTAKIGGAQVALKKLLIHNPRDGVGPLIAYLSQLTAGLGHNRPRNQNPESAQA